MSVFSLQFCSRSPWESDAAEIKKIVDMGSNLNHEGYVNVGAQLGLSGERGKSPFGPIYSFRLELC